MDLNKKALSLEYLTVGYNILEGVLSILAGWLSGSIALIGFGLDSGIESLSGGVLIWRLTQKGLTQEEEEKAERKAIRLVGLSFFVLGVYVAIESARKLVLAEAPEPTLFGIVIAALSLVTMPILSYSKFRVARKLGSKSLEADSKQTLVCAMLSVALLIGLGLNYLFGLWWADPAAALVIVVFIMREGVEAWKEGRACGC